MRAQLDFVLGSVLGSVLALSSLACAPAPPPPPLSPEAAAVQIFEATQDSTKWLRDNCEFRVMEPFDSERQLRERAVQVGANVAAVIDERTMGVATTTHTASGNVVWRHYSYTEWTTRKSVLYACPPGVVAWAA